MAVASRHRAEWRCPSPKEVRISPARSDDSFLASASHGSAANVPREVLPVSEQQSPVQADTAAHEPASVHSTAPVAAPAHDPSSLDAFPGGPHLCVEVLMDGAAGAPTPTPTDHVEIHYACLVAKTGGCVDASRSKMFSERTPFAIRLGSGQVVPGMEQGILLLKLGALARLHVPSRLAYGAQGAGVIPPHADLVFEVELLRVGAHKVPPKSSYFLRRLLLLPVAAGVAAVESGPHCVRMPEAMIAAAQKEAAAEQEHAARSDPDVDAARAATQLPSSEGQLPAWLCRLRSALPMPTPECATFFTFLRDYRRAIARGGGVVDILPDALPIAKVAYGTAWDSRRPIVLTGVRRDWPAREWGWSFWEKEFGEEQVLCKQRAPMFESDQSANTLMAECTLHEALAYSRTAHLSPAPEAGQAPVLYMNGWDVFQALPQLWDPKIAELPGSINNLTISEFRKLHHRVGIDDEQSLTRRVSQLCKLFVGPQGAITRIHQDNHDAHAWLTNLRGRKLYVLASPDADASLILGADTQDGERTAGARFDPLDPHQRAERPGLQLHAVVLEPGETIIAPSGWWHFAACLEPTITLMCNFWDEANLIGLHDCFYDQAARAMDGARKKAALDFKAGVPGAKSPSPTIAADLKAPLLPFEKPVQYAVVHSPWVYLRIDPSTDAEIVGVVRPGKILHMSHRLDGWLRTATPVHKGYHGWALETGKQLGLGVLLRPVQ